MPDNRTALHVQPDADESLGELLRTRALASSSRLLIGQAAAGVALNSAVVWWHPERWGIAAAAATTIALHALWSVAVQRTTAEDAAAERSHGTSLVTTRDKSSRGAAPRDHDSWRRARRASAIGASLAALLLLWFVCMMLLGRLMS